MFKVEGIFYSDSIIQNSTINSFQKDITLLYESLTVFPIHLTPESQSKYIRPRKEKGLSEKNYCNVKGVN